MMCGVLVAAAILLSAPCLAVDTVPPTDAHVLEWLNAPEHTDFDWKVQLFSPRLSFQQRRVAGIRAALPIRKLLRAGISLAGLRFVFKVADSDGHWMPGQYDDNFIPTADVQKAKELVFYAHFFVQPGRYKVAVLAYDRRTRRSNLWKRIRGSRAEGRSASGGRPEPAVGRIAGRISARACQAGRGETSSAGSQSASDSA